MSPQGLLTASSHGFQIDRAVEAGVATRQNKCFTSAHGLETAANRCFINQPS